MNKKLEKEIRELENAGIKVVTTKKDKLNYVTGGINNSCNVCDSCANLVFLPDPDKHDWFRDGDQKAVCTKMDAAIERHLERPSEMINLEKPIWCPNLGRQLTEEELKIYDFVFEIAKSDF